MAKECSVFGVFPDRHSAEQAVHDLESHQFTDKEVSLLAKGQAKNGSKQDSVGDGAAWGAGIGATAGILAGVGLLAIPGIGPILAAGPIAAGLAGAGAGGLAGGLMDYGIPAQTSHKLEGDVKRGEGIVLVKCDEKRAEDAADRLRHLGAHDVEVHATHSGQNASHSSAQPDHGPVSDWMGAGNHSSSNR